MVWYGTYIVSAENFKTVQQKVADLLKDRVLVGHALHNDMKVIFYVLYYSYCNLMALQKCYM